MGSEHDTSAIPDDPFARMAAALAERPPASQTRPRRPSPSYADLLPPISRPAPPGPPPGSVQAHSPSNPPPSRPRHDLPDLPSVIVTDDPPVVPRPRTSDAPTMRGGRSFQLDGSEAPSTMRMLPVLGLLALSIAVFGIAMTIFLFARSPAPSSSGHAALTSFSAR